MNRIKIFMLLVSTATVALRDNKIVGGEYARIGQFKHQVSIQDLGEDRVLAPHICGGSIIADSWILTAAHCVSKYKAKDLPSLFVAVGITDLQYIPVEKTYGISKIIIHKGFAKDDPKQKDNIALLELTENIKYDETTDQIKLYTGLPIPTNTELTAIGWGFISNPGNGALSNKLKYVYLKKIPKSKCEDYTEKFNLTIDMNQICTIDSLNRGPCYGDYGGPLVLGKDYQKLVGIVAYNTASRCGNGFPTVYTRVSEYRKWIRNVTNLKIL